MPFDGDTGNLLRLTEIGLLFPAAETKFPCQAWHGARDVLKGAIRRLPSFTDYAAS